MYTALHAASETIAEYLRQRLKCDSNLAIFFDSGNGGTMVVSLNRPQEMSDGNTERLEGLSVWLYRVVRDEQRLNAPPQRVAQNQLQRAPLPVRLYYLITPIVHSSPGTEQEILGKVLQIFHDHPKLRGTDLQSDLEGAAVELSVRLESLSLEEITRVWDALDKPYQLSVSYEVSVVYIHSAQEPMEISPVEVVIPEYGVVVSSEESLGK